LDELHPRPCSMSIFIRNKSAVILDYNSRLSCEYMGGAPIEESHSFMHDTMQRRVFVIGFASKFVLHQSQIPYMTSSIRRALHTYSASEDELRH
jgi:hypothetical protein